MAPARRLVQFSEVERQNFVRASSPLFDGVVFWINPILGKDECARVADLLMLGGAKPATIRHQRVDSGQDDIPAVGREYKLNGVLVQPIPQMVNHIARFYLPLRADSAETSDDGILRVTHIVTPDTHFGEHTAACRAGVRIVTAQWVDRCVKTGWQYIERYFSPEAQDIFSGMVVAATHMPVADKETLLASVMALGGQWREKMRADVTHLILMKDDGPKYEFAAKHPELGIKPILPHWFKETLNLLHRVPQEPYTFPDPPMLEGKTLRRSAASPSTTNAAAAADPVASGSAPDSGNVNAIAVPNAETHNGSAYELPKPSAQFLRGYVVAISTQLRYSLSEGAIVRLTQRLVEAGAMVAKPAPAVDGIDITKRSNLPESLVTDWDSIDILICQHRSGYEYSKASRLGKLVGTFVWLYQAYLSEQIAPPTKRLLHYPAPTAPVRGMERMAITISGYTGAAREYLRRLILAMGAQYTPKMTRTNTHLITAAPEGRKYDKAIEWDIYVVNHFWVEQCYQRWKLLSVTHPTFTYFPELPMLNSMVGDTEINISKLRAWVDSPQGNSLAESSDMDILNDDDFDPVPSAGSNAGHSSLAVKTDTGHIYEIPDNAMASTNADDSDNDARSIPDSEKSSDEKPGQEPLALGQLRHTPRAAAMAASRTLGEMMKAANIFETEMRKEKLSKYRKQHNSRRSLVLGAEEREDGSSSDDDEEDGDEDSGDAAQAEDSRRGSKRVGGPGSPVGGPKSAGNTPGGHKRQRTQAGVRDVRIMFTQVRPTLNEQRRIIDMGGEIVEEASVATHLVSKEIRRTAKMLIALASGRVAIVGRNWMEDSLAQHRWIPVDPSSESDEAAKYHLVDEEAEKKWSFRLSESLHRAQVRRLFEGVTVFITPKAEPPLPVLRPLIEAAGGEAVDSLPKPRLNALINATCRILKNKSLDDSAIPPLLVITCREDSHLWPQFQSLHGKRLPMYGTELILTGLLRQRVTRTSLEFDMH
ncbi:regulator of Ty1 Transposition [Dipsacomyces acuminosporus]|nr:regulator of Ty1 Transposition [Dipsacomyces acuminosporus]